MEGCDINTKIKLGIVALMAILSVMLLALVAPKSKAFDADVWASLCPLAPDTVLSQARQYATNEGITNTDYYIIYVYPYNNQTTYTAIESYFLDNGNSISCNTNTQYNWRSDSKVYRAKISWNADRTTGTFVNYNQRQGRQNNYVDINKLCPDGAIYTNIPLTVNNNVVPLPVNIHDEFYIGAQGWNIQYTVQAGTESLDNGWWHSSKNYVLKCSATLNGQPAVVTIPNYPAWYMQVKLVNIKPVGELIELPTAKPQPYMNIQSYFHAVSYYPGVLLNPSQDALYAPDVPFSDQWKDAPEDMTSIHITQLHKLYLDIDNTIPNDFLKQNLTFSWVGADDNRVYYSKTLNYSQADWGLITPPDSDNTDWTDTISNIINDINRYNNYELLHNPPLGWDKPVFGQLEQLTDFSAPDIVYTLPSVDPDAQGFFAWIVSFFFNSPMGIVFSTILLFFILSHLLNN